MRNLDLLTDPENENGTRRASVATTTMSIVTIRVSHLLSFLRADSLAHLPR